MRERFPEASLHGLESKLCLPLTVHNLSGEEVDTATVNTERLCCSYLPIDNARNLTGLSGKDVHSIQVEVSIRERQCPKSWCLFNELNDKIVIR